MGLFSNIFKKILQEDNTSSSAFGAGSSAEGIFSPPGTISSGDRYAPGDARIPFAFGTKRKGKRKKKILIQRRNLK